MDISIIMPVLNEELIIAETLAATRRVVGDAELIVVDGGSADRTPELARPYAPVVSARRGRAVQMNAGAMLARGEVLLFQHADTLMPPGALDMVRCIRQATPDSLQYLIKDMFETVTFYDNKMLAATKTPMPNGRFLVNLAFMARCV